MKESLYRFQTYAHVSCVSARNYSSRYNKFTDCTVSSHELMSWSKNATVAAREGQNSLYQRESLYRDFSLYSVQEAAPFTPSGCVYTGRCTSQVCFASVVTGLPAVINWTTFAGPGSLISVPGAATVDSRSTLLSDYHSTLADICHIEEDKKMFSRYKQCSNSSSQPFPSSFAVNLSNSMHVFFRNELRGSPRHGQL